MNLLITGASDGIGKAIAQEFVDYFKNRAEKGQIFLISRNLEKLEALKQELDFDGLHVYGLDLNDEQGIINFCQYFLEDKVGALDLLINNAGIWQKTCAPDMLESECIRDVIGTNLTAQMIFTKHMLKLIKKSSMPRIMNIISRSGLEANGDRTAYNASKWGFRGYTNSLREAYKGEIQVCGVYQGGTKTSFFEKAGDDRNMEGYTEPGDLARLLTTIAVAPKSCWTNEIHIDRK